jgi:hypothetical protein
MNTYNIGLTLNIETKDSSLDATYIRTKLMPTLKDELKKASMKGEFILADRGIRTI